MKLLIATLLLAVASTTTALLHPAPSHLVRRNELLGKEQQWHLDELEEETHLDLLAKPSRKYTQGPTTGVALPTELAFQEIVDPLLEKIDFESLKSWLVRMTLFPERYYLSENGVKAALWIVDEVAKLPVPPGAKLTVGLFNHTWNVQPSVIARYEPEVPTNLTGIVITGSHFDTIAYGTKPHHDEPNLNPAADDCASGSSVVFESLRTLTLNGFIPSRPIEFHWYAAEEEGLYGSLEIAEAYAKAGTKVLTYLNLDQSGYIANGTVPVMGLVTDYTRPASTALLKKVVERYTHLEPKETECGYACTDHASWFVHGYEAGFVFESVMENAFPYNDRVKPDGSPLDTLDWIDFPHVLEFARATVGYVVEMSLAPDTPLPTLPVTVTATATATEEAPTETPAARRR
ncbi:hypothetical protein HDU96_001247 [Phlyctochytrium bullatum]|nr:hypothetical protein HDU96_001247 [Phlyctochytrium bullatum]